MHGVYIVESPTRIQVPVPVDSSIPIAVGVAPVHRLENPALAVNNPSMSFSYGEIVADMGYSDNWKKFPLCEVIFSQFRVHAIAPLILINVWNPLRDAQDVAIPDLPIVNGVATIDDEMAMISTVIVRNGSGNYVRGKDFTLKYDGDNLLITIKEDGDIPAGTTSLSVSYKQATVANITKNDIAGGVDPDTNKRTGIELVTEIFPLLKKVVGFFIAPAWSSDPEIYALMCAKAHNLGYRFTCIVCADLPTLGEYRNYRKMPKWKDDNSYVDAYSFLTWPCVAIGDGYVR